MGYLVRYYFRINKKKQPHEVMSIFKVILIKIEIFKFSESVFKNKVERDMVQYPMLNSVLQMHLRTYPQIYHMDYPSRGLPCTKKTA